MNNETKDVAASILNSLDKKNDIKEVEGHVDYDVVREMENSLSSFLRHRLLKLQEDSEFEEEVVNALSARLSEATFMQLMSLLKVLKNTANAGTLGVLAPFIAKAAASGSEPAGGRKKATTAEDLFNAADSKEILQGLSQLATLIDEVKKARPKKEDQ
jgi:hypothetical protein